MTPSTSELLERLDSLGVTIATEDGNLVLRPASAVPKAMVPEIRECKADLIRALGATRFYPSKVCPDDPLTWPPYLCRIEATAREHVGEEAARRQVAAEIAFLEWCANDESWIILPHGLDKEENNNGA